MKIYPKQYIISSDHEIKILDSTIYNWKNYNIAIYWEDKELLHLGENYIFFGEIFDFENPEKNNQEILESINFRTSKEEIFQQLMKISGYYFFLLETENETIIFNDTASQQECYFANDFGINIAQQPHLLQHLLGEKYRETDKNATPKVIDARRNVFYKTIFERISKLIPNHYYSFQQKKFIRFYPFKEIQQKNTDIAIEEIIRVLQGTMKALTHRKPVVSALTSGWDSRILLACNKFQIDKIDFFTIANVHPYSDIDVSIAQRILDCFDKKLQILNYKKEEDNFFPHEAVFVHDNANEIITEVFYKRYFKNKYLINGNISEVGRFYYRPLPKNLSPKELAYIVKCEEDDYHLPLFTHWQKEFRPFKSLSYDELDFLYWEHRISNWLGALKSIYNVNTTVISPFNNRYLLDVLFSMDKKYRDSRFPKYYKKILEQLVPELNDIPVNPMDSIKKIKLSKTLGLYPFTKAIRLKTRTLH